MSNYILTALDVTGIQRYIFNSNRLKENVGASELVYRATTRFVFEALPEFNNVKQVDPVELDPDKTIEDLEAEVLFAVGGNALIIFKDIMQAHKLVAELSQRLIEEAPGLELTAAHLEFEWEVEPIAQVRKNVLALLQEVKNRQVYSQPLLGLGVTVACQSTGLPAVAIHPDKEDENYPVSAEVWAKVEIAEQANNRFKGHIKDDQSVWQEILDKPYYFPMEFDDFGRSKDDHSYIAVVHADVNGMGKRIDDIFDNCQEKNLSDREAINTVRKFSDQVGTAARVGLVEMVKTLVNAVDKNKKISGEIPLSEKKDKNGKQIGYYLPFRPLVFGGDDLTFVCDGRLGLSLVETYFKAFEAAIDNKEITACAGVSVVKTHYPFARAYQIAEDLCAEAKRFVDRKTYGLDWHFAASGLLGKLETIREKQYTVDAGKLYMRPVSLTATNGEWRTWENVQQTIETFKNSSAWAEQHNKVMKLRRALRDGQPGVRQFLTAYEESQLPQMKHPTVTGLHKTGWVEAPVKNTKKNESICGYFDSIEAMEFYVPLKSMKGVA